LNGTRIVNSDFRINLLAILTSLCKILAKINIKNRIYFNICKLFVKYWQCHAVVLDEIDIFWG
jgi:hypothetical protein